MLSLAKFQANALINTYEQDGNSLVEDLGLSLTVLEPASLQGHAELVGTL